MPESFLLSVIIPVHNRARVVADCVDSVLVVLEQCRHEMEVVLVDDASTDGTWETCTALTQRGGNVRAVRLRQNSGPGAARNAGIGEARGEYLFFLDSDDTLAAETAVDVLQTLRQHPEADVFLLDALLEGTGTPRLRRNGGSETQQNRALPCQEFLDGLPAPPMVWQCIVRRDFLKRHAIQFPATYYSEDIPFTLKMLFSAENIYLFRASLCRHQLGVSDSLMVNMAQKSPQVYAGVEETLSVLQALYRTNINVNRRRILDIQLYEMLFVLLGAQTEQEIQKAVQGPPPAEPLPFGRLSYALLDRMAPQALPGVFLKSLLAEVARLTGGEKALYLCPACPRTLLLLRVFTAAGVRVAGFIDNHPAPDNPTVQRCREQGYSVARPQELSPASTVVLVSSNQNIVRELVCQFEALGYAAGANLIVPCPGGL